MAQKQLKRNLFAIDPIMRKGGVHEKTNKAKRKNEKMKWKKAAHSGEPFAFLVTEFTCAVSPN